MSIARGTAFNLLGLAAPLPLAVIAFPTLIAALGEGRFGVLTIIWAVTTYFGLFDMGLGRALTLKLSVALDQGHDASIGPLSATALMVMAVLGCVGAMLLIVLAPSLAGLTHGAPDQSEVVESLQVMGLALPFITLTAGLRGMLEARRAFDLVNYVRIPLGLWTFAGPCCQVIWREADLVEITLVLLGGRVLACVAHALLAWRALPQLRGNLRPQVAVFGPLVRSGGWLTLSNLIGPLIGYADRFILGAIVSASAVAYYATPQEVMSRLWILPGALSATLFPMLAATLASGDARSRSLCHKALLWLIPTLLPLTLGPALFAHELLDVWLGPAFAAQSALPLQCFALGMFATGVAQIPYAALQSGGHASKTAWLHALELPVFVASLVWAAGRYGIDGAAMVWCARCIIDAALLFACSAGAVRVGDQRLFGRTAAIALMLSGVCFIGLLLPAQGLRLSWLIGICGVAAALAWRQLRAAK